MKLLVVAPRLPFPLDKGDRLTIYHLLRYFSAHHRIALVCFVEPEQSPEWIEEVRPFCEEIEMVPLSRKRAYFNCGMGILGSVPLQVRYFEDPEMRRVVGRVIERFQPDLLYAHLIRMAPYILPYDHRPRVVAFNVSMTLNYRRLAEHSSGFFRRLFFGLEYRKVRKFEANFARQFESALFISPYDVDSLELDSPLENVSFNPHGVDFEYFSPDSSVSKEAATVIMTGNMNYAPNVDAALYFCEEILPRIREAVPEVRVWLVGADPTAEVQALADGERVVVSGRVPDLRGYMNRAQVGVAPIRIGAGLQNKLLEGMSMGLPMVATPVANEGIQARAGEHLIIAGDAARFADAVVNLLNDEDGRESLGQAARRYIVDHWSWESHFANLDRLFEELVATRDDGAAQPSDAHASLSKERVDD